MAQGPEANLAARTHRALGHVARVRMLELIRQGSRTVGELATVTRLHPNTVRSHLRVLQDAGLVDGARDPRPTSGRPRTLYRLAVPPAAGSDAAHELMRVLAEALRQVADDPGAAAEDAAMPWGRATVADVGSVGSPEDAVGKVVEELDAIGFDPELRHDDDGSMQVLLHRCPFDDLAREYGDIVCAAHLGLVRGALEQLGASVRAELTPFVTPTTCLTQLTVQGRSDG